MKFEIFELAALQTAFYQKITPFQNFTFSNQITINKIHNILVYNYQIKNQ